MTQSDINTDSYQCKIHTFNRYINRNDMIRRCYIIGSRRATTSHNYDRFVQQLANVSNCMLDQILEYCRSGEQDRVGLLDGMGEWGEAAMGTVDMIYTVLDVLIKRGPDTTTSHPHGMSAIPTNSVFTL